MSSSPGCLEPDRLLGEGDEEKEGERKCASSAFSVDNGVAKSFCARPAGSLSLSLSISLSRCDSVHTEWKNRVTGMELGTEIGKGTPAQPIQVNADDETGPALYSFSKPPPLNVETSWFEDFKEKMAPNTHKEWVYQLNVGSEINISYSITGSSPLTLVIAEGIENLVEWIDDPSYPNTTLSWNIIQGNGSIHQKIFKESEYYVAVGNLLPDELEVKLKFGIHSLLYNVTGAYDQCKLENGLCVLKLLIFGANAAVLTTPSKKMGEEGNNWYVTLSYGPRWVTYFVGSGALTIIVLLVFKFISKFRSTSGDRIHHQSETLAPERTPLISDQDDDLSSYGSSYDSASNDEEGQEDNVGGLDSVEVKTLEEGDTNKQRRLCVICFDAPRDSFFLPCGHCAACFPCGMRISEELGSCPICNRKLKKVKKIFTV
ncbi:E3 ubiquitin-protein ligase APD2 isoform X3 [Nymphaea colorata]|uniref:E3 ubiquitin-protein ligase APD2 isoform X3 n=1 Tax=Nymphaea colorata TaxID=210225 RepID=UPI00214E015F|nr:E3 ubiquitin-protein ligase APD2 isoform X3 [Nymphaea colorata]